MNDNSDEIPPPPFSSRVNVDIFGMSDKGNVRANNEDHFLIVRAGRAVETIMTNLTVDEECAFREVGVSQPHRSGPQERRACQRHRNRRPLLDPVITRIYPALLTHSFLQAIHGLVKDFGTRVVEFYQFL